MSGRNTLQQIIFELSADTGPLEQQLQAAQARVDALNAKSRATESRLRSDYQKLKEQEEAQEKRLDAIREQRNLAQKKRTQDEIRRVNDLIEAVYRLEEAERRVQAAQDRKKSARANRDSILQRVQISEKEIEDELRNIQEKLPTLQLAVEFERGQIDKEFEEVSRRLEQAQAQQLRAQATERDYDERLKYQRELVALIEDEANIRASIADLKSKGDKDSLDEAADREAELNDALKNREGIQSKLLSLIDRHEASLKSLNLANAKLVDTERDYNKVAEDTEDLTARQIANRKRYQSAVTALMNTEHRQLELAGQSERAEIRKADAIRVADERIRNATRSEERAIDMREKANNSIDEQGAALATLEAAGKSQEAQFTSDQTKVQNSLKETRRAIENFDDQYTEAMESVRAQTLQAEVKVDSLKNKLKSMGSSFKDAFGRGMRSQAGPLGNLGNLTGGGLLGAAGFGAGAGLMGMVTNFPMMALNGITRGFQGLFRILDRGTDTFRNIIGSASEFNQEIVRFSLSTGLATRDANEFVAVFRLLGGDTYWTAMGLEQLNKNIIQNNKFFTEMGVATRNADGGLRSVADVIRDLNKLYQEADSEGKKNFIANFNQAMPFGSMIMPFFTAGWSELVDYLERTNVIMDELEQKRLTDVTASVASLRMAAQGVFNTITIALAPAIKEVSNIILQFLTDNIHRIEAFFRAVSNVITGLLSALGLVSKTDYVGDVAQAMDAVAQSGQGSIDAVQELNEAIDENISKTDEMIEGLREALDTEREAISDLKDEMEDLIDPLEDAIEGIEDELKKKLHPLEWQIELLETAKQGWIDERDAALSAIDDQIRALQRRNRELKRAMEDRIDPLTGQIEDLQDKRKANTKAAKLAKQQSDQEIKSRYDTSGLEQDSENIQDQIKEIQKLEKQEDRRVREQIRNIESLKDAEKERIDALRKATKEWEESQTDIIENLQEQIEAIQDVGEAATRAAQEQEYWNRRAYLMGQTLLAQAEARQRALGFRQQRQRGENESDIDYQLRMQMLNSEMDVENLKKAEELQQLDANRALELLNQLRQDQIRLLQDQVKAIQDEIKSRKEADDAAIEAIQATIDGYDLQLKGIRDAHEAFKLANDLKIEGLQEENEAIRDQIKLIKDQEQAAKDAAQAVQDNYQRINDELEEQIETLQEQIDAIKEEYEPEIKENTREIEDLNEEQEDIKDEFNPLIEEAQAAIDDLQRGIDNLEMIAARRIELIEEEIEAIKERYELQMEQHEDVIKALEKELKAAEKLKRALAKDKKELEPTFATATQDINDATSALDDLGRKTDGVFDKWTRLGRAIGNWIQTNLFDPFRSTYEIEERKAKDAFETRIANTVGPISPDDTWENSPEKAEFDNRWWSDEDMERPSIGTAIKTMIENVWEEIKPTLKELVSKIWNTILTESAIWLRENPDKFMLLAFALVVLLFPGGPLLFALGFWLGLILIGAWEWLKENTVELIKWGWELGGKLLGGIWEALKALGAGLKKTFWDPIDAYFTEYIPWAFNRAVEFGKKILDGIWDAIKTIGSKFKEWIWDPLDKLFTDLIPSAFKWAVDLGKKILDGIWDAIKAAGSKFKEWIWDPLDKLFTDLIPEAFKWAVDLAVKILDGIWDGIKFIAEKFKEWVWDPIDKFFTELVPEAFKWSVDLATGILDGIWDGIQFIGTKIKEWIWDPIEDLFNGTMGLIEKVFGWAQEMGGKVLDGMLDKLKDIGNWLWNNIGDPIVGFFEGVIDKVGRVFSAFWGAVRGPISTVWNGFADFINGVVGAVNGVLGKIGLPTWDIKVDKFKDPQPAPSVDTSDPHLYGGGTTRPGARRGDVFDRPEVVEVGEGGFREYVISSDPQYKERSLGMVGDLLKRLGVTGSAVKAQEMKERDPGVPVHGPRDLSQRLPKGFGGPLDFLGPVENLWDAGGKIIGEFSDIAKDLLFKLPGVPDLTQLGNLGGMVMSTIKYIGTEIAEWVWDKVKFWDKENNTALSLDAMTKNVGNITQRYGYTPFALAGNYGGGPHTGVDLGTPHGTPLYAPGGPSVLEEYDDRITWNGWATRSGGYGTWASVHHLGTGLRILVAHLSRVVKSLAGKRIPEGEPFAYTGNTGYSSDPHLHVEVTGPNGRVNPEVYFKNESLPGYRFGGLIRPNTTLVDATGRPYAHAGEPGVIESVTPLDFLKSNIRSAVRNSIAPNLAGLSSISNAHNIGGHNLTVEIGSIYASGEAEGREAGQALVEQLQGWFDGLATHSSSVRIGEVR